MKKTLFALAALATLATACVKEQQPSVTPADQGVTTIRVTVAQTKVAVNETTGACTWQSGDQLAVWYQNNEDNTAGKKVIFTYKGLLEDGSAEFTTTEDVAGYTAVRAAHPTGSIKDDGGFGLVTNWTYDAERRPVYVRSENITTNPDGSLSAQLGHNASIFKFTLHDIPAYAAGFVLESVKYAASTDEDAFVDKDGDKIDRDNQTGTFKIVTKFPYKTGYTADPADYSNDITLYSVAPHSSYLTRVYLIDGKGDEIEGSERKFKQSWNDVSNDDFIELPRVDFKKADLRQGYVLLYGVKWAKGNLRYDSNVTGAGFQTGWGLTETQWEYIGYDVTSSSAIVDGKEVTYTYTGSQEEMRISRTESLFEHFNFGGLGKFSYMASDYLEPSKTTTNLDISGKIYSDAAATKEVTGTDRFAEVNGDTPNLYGDLAFWASKGKYRLPSVDDMTPIHNVTSKIPGWYVANGFKVWGFLFRYPDLGYDRKADATANQNREFSDADLETGLFFPCGGRVADASSNPDAVNVVIGQRTASAYRASLFVKWNGAGVNTLAAYYTNKLFTQFDSTNKLMTGRSGMMIRPVLVETAE